MAKIFTVISFVLISLCTYQAQAEVNQELPPLASATELEVLDQSEIRQRYPKGLSIFSNTLTPSLKSKLEALSKDGFTINWVRPNIQELQALTHSAIKKSGISYFLVKAYGERPGCSPFFQNEFLPFVLRKNNATDVTSLKKLKDHSASYYSSVLEQHHLWKNIGYRNMTRADSAVQEWIVSASKVTESISQSALMDCKVSLDSEQLVIINRLITLDYLSNAVRGLFYKKLGTPLTHYRQLAVDSLNKLKH